VLDIIQHVNGNVIGADIVEYNPTKDHHDMTAYLAAKMMKEILVRMH
ncbi:MAG: agmatinase, partial [Eudoraea sp.]|nr:agmatinase [Eudoraea sp.]